MEDAEPDAAVGSNGDSGDVNTTGGNVNFASDANATSRRDRGGDGNGSNSNSNSNENSEHGQAETDRSEEGSQLHRGPGNNPTLKHSLHTYIRTFQ